jgi:hypothetical protein
MPERDRRPGQRRNRLLQFRVGVITVMAAHRLFRLGQQCCRCFVAYDAVSAGNGILVVTGGVKLPPTVSPGGLNCGVVLYDMFVFFSMIGGAA